MGIESDSRKDIVFNKCSESIELNDAKQLSDNKLNMFLSKLEICNVKESCQLGRLIDLNDLESNKDYLIPKLSDLLRNGQFNGRKNASYALDNIKSISAIEPLMMGLKDTNDEVRESCAYALRFKTDLPGWRDNIKEPLYLLVALSDTSPVVRSLTLNIIGVWDYYKYDGLNACDVELHLFNMLDDYDPRVRAAAAFAVGLNKPINNDKLIDKLVSKLDDEDGNVREACTSAISLCKIYKAITRIIRSLKDENAGVRSKCAFALWTMDAKVAVPDLIELLKDNNESVRKAAKRALSIITGNETADTYEEWVLWYESGK